MRFFSKIRAFLSIKDEILDKQAEHTRKITHLEHSFLELDEFVHKMARKRYAENNKSVLNTEIPESQEVIEPEMAPPVSEIPNMRPGKFELWQQARKMNPGIVRRAG